MDLTIIIVGTITLLTLVIAIAVATDRQAQTAAWRRIAAARARLAEQGHVGQDARARPCAGCPYRNLGLFERQ